MLESSRSSEAFGFYIENDSRNMGGPGSDRAYSNGFKFSYVYAENHIPKWSEGPVGRLHVLDQAPKNAKLNLGISLGQQIYTPEDISRRTLVVDDRPYAAWLYVGFAISFKEQKSGQFLELDLGMVGPSARGQQMQNSFHDMISQDAAQGWGNGLHDEATLQINYQKRYKTLNKKYADFFPYIGAGLGNVLIGTHVGGIIRFGLNLPDDFGPSRPSASDGDSFISRVANSKSNKKSYYVFAGARANALMHNIFLDGNTFKDNHSVTKYPFTSENELGFGIQILPINMVWRYVVRSPEFSQKSNFNNFASVNMLYLF